MKKKKVLLAVCGSVSAYVAVEVADYLKKNGADVHVLMTENACRFVTPLTFQAVSGRPVACDLYVLGDTWKIPHIDLTQQADLMLVLPATATTLAKVASGMADNVVTASVLSSECPVYFAPTMNIKMYANQATQKNLKRLRELGYHIIEPAEGKMICGATGPGKMQSAEYLCRYVKELLEE